MALEVVQKENGEDDKEVYDSSLDHKGRLPLRSSTGTWKASCFIIAIELGERLSYFSMASNLITYLTKVMHQDLTTAAKTVNCWAGVSTSMPLLGGFIADAYTGRFLMIWLSSLIYLMGLIILTMTQFIPSLKPCGVDKSCVNPTKIHKLTFFTAMYCLSLGTGGIKPSLESFGGDQFDDNSSKERKGKMSYFNWWNAALCAGIILGVTVMAYIQDNFGWGTADLILTIVMLIATVIFYLGKPIYRYRAPQGSPLTPMLQVLVAAMRNRKLPYPTSPDSFYESGEDPQTRLLAHTTKLRFLDKACVVRGNEVFEGGKKPSPWKLSTVTKVEETKLALHAIPIWFASLLFGVGIAQCGTFFVKQSSTMNRKIGNGFVIPPASIQAIAASGMLLFVVCYDKMITPMLRRMTGNERGISILQRVGIGMVLSVIGMAVAALVEKQRLIVADKEKSRVLSMSVFWLTPQYLILGIGDAFTLVGLQEYFYEQVPDSMRSIGIALYSSVLGVGSFYSSFLIYVVGQVTGKFGSSWFGKDLNSSRLDKFYWLLAAMSGLNFVIYGLMTRKYSYKSVQRKVVVTSK